MPNRWVSVPASYGHQESREPGLPIHDAAGDADVDYIRKVRAAGGIRKYERTHLNALVASFAPKFSHLPKELVRRVVEYAFHVGDY